MSERKLAKSNHRSQTEMPRPPHPANGKGPWHRSIIPRQIDLVFPLLLALSRIEMAPFLYRSTALLKETIWYVLGNSPPNQEAIVTIEFYIIIPNLPLSINKMFYVEH